MNPLRFFAPPVRAAFLVFAAACAWAATLTVTAPSPMPSATVGQSYSAPLSANGTAPYRWSSSGNLPPGLTVDPASGLISGVASQSGTFAFTVQVTDATQSSGSKSLIIVVAPQPLTITTTAPLFTASVGVPYAQTFAAAGGAPPYQWSILSGSTGALTLDPRTGTLQGTASATGTLNFTIQVTDSASAKASQAFSITVAPAAVAIVTSAILPDGSVGTPYNQQLSATGGTQPYTWKIASGAVPGLSLASDTGVLSNTPSTAGTFTFTVQVTDSAGSTASKTFRLNIAATALKITSSTQLPDGVGGTAYAQTLAAIGGLAPYTWSANGLPSGLSIDPSSGAISGTPAAAGTFTFTIRVIDANHTAYTDLFHLNIGVPALPSVSITGLNDPATPASQPTVQVTLSAPYAGAISGHLTLAFTPDQGAGDSTIQFSTGGLGADFNIPAGATSAVFSAPGFALQTGTVAGSLSVSMTLQAFGIDVTPSPAPSRTVHVPAAAPAITAVTVNRNSTGFDLVVTGYATNLQVSQAVFNFTAASGSVLQAGSVTVTVDSVFSKWFQNPAAAGFGSQFKYTQSFTVQGDPNAVIPQSVALSNAVGSQSFTIHP